MGQLFTDLVYYKARNLFFYKKYIENVYTAGLKRGVVSSEP